jgi:fluoride exporter
MKALLIVALGGGIGSVGRYLLSGVALHRTISWQFPLGTFLVNVLGCLAVGVLGGLAVRHDLFSADTRLFLFTGLAGGFTTFSAFGLETFYLLRKDEPAIAAAYVILSVLAGIFVLWAGFSAALRSPA